MLKKILLVSALFTSISASAATMTVSDSFGTQGSPTDVGIGTLNETLTIAGFDTLGGTRTLTGVDVTVFGQIDSEGSSTNQSNANSRATVDITLTDAWTVSTSAADDHVFAPMFTSILSGQSAAPGTFNLGTGDTFLFDLTTGELSASLMNVDVASFLAATVDFTFATTAFTGIANQVQSGTGQSLNAFSTGSWGRVEVTYTYRPTTTDVSAPGTLALAGLSLIGFAAFRKSRAK